MPKKEEKAKEESSKNNKKKKVPEFLKSQIITYMGNKRKELPHIEELLQNIKKELGKNKLKIGDGFAGSGVVSRLFKLHASELHTNDLAGYSRSLNRCYLATPTNKTYAKICEYVDEANRKADAKEVGEPWIEKHWTGERAYYTKDNGRRIDAMRQYIDTIPNEFRDYVLAPLLVECSIHTNTSGQFASFHRGGYGGKKGTDTKRITQDIRIPYPIFDKTRCKTSVSQMDVKKWASNLPKDLDVIYYDPPYNKHPYNIYYFLLDIINNYDTSIHIPDTYRGQPKEWIRSLYNSSTHAKNELKDLLLHTHSKFVIISYFDKGIISFDEFADILNSHTKHWEKIPVLHSTFNRLRGLAKSKQLSETELSETKDFLFFLHL
jgi:adenine-specific DNA-methyltransferase